MPERPVATLSVLWRTEAERLERFCPPAATAFRDAALQLEAALREEAGELLTLSEAASLSGLSAEHLRHLVASGAIPNAGRKGAPRVKRADLPKKTKHTGPMLYDVDADARRLTQGARR